MPKLNPPTPMRIAELLMEHARDYAILGLDRQGRIVSWSPGAERVIGYSEAEALGREFGMLFTPSDLAAGEPERELERAWRDGRAEDSRWHLRSDGMRFWANGTTMAVDEGETKWLIKIVRDETAARLAEEQRVLLLNELNHRINNTLATVQSIVEQTLRSSAVDPSVRESVTERLMALSAAHRVLVDQSWAGADLLEVVGRVLDPYKRLEEPRIHIDGPPVRLSARQALAMSMVLHELATNAVKYGALSQARGEVSLSWNMRLDREGMRHLTLLWEESGGPPVSPPTRRGFGSRLIAGSFAERNEGKAQVEYAPGGVRCTITLALSEAGEVPIMDIAAAGAVAQS